jgi:hypothetical protein
VKPALHQVQQQQQQQEEEEEEEEEEEHGALELATAKCAQALTVRCVMASMRLWRRCCRCLFSRSRARAGSGVANTRRSWVAQPV